MKEEREERNCGTGDHEDLVKTCGECGRESYFSCCGDTNVHCGKYGKDCAMLCPGCKANCCKE